MFDYCKQMRSAKNLTLRCGFHTHYGLKIKKLKGGVRFLSLKFCSKPIVIIFYEGGEKKRL